MDLSLGRHDCASSPGDLEVVLRGRSRGRGAELEFGLSPEAARSLATALYTLAARAEDAS